MNEKIEKMKNIRFDFCFLRIMATLAVIFLHTCNTISNNTSIYDLSIEELAFFTSGNYVMNWAVPAFLMISGGLLLRKDKKISYGICLSKYCKRILLALFVFGVPFSALELISSEQTVSPMLIVTAIQNVVSGKSWSHLWYLYALIGVYLVLPVIKSFTDNAGKKDIAIFLTILFLFNSVVPLFESIFDFEVGFLIPISSYTVFYLVLGVFFDEYIPKVLTKRSVSTIVIFVCTVTIVILNSKVISKGSVYFGSGSVLITLTVIAIFSLIKGIDFKHSEHIWKIDRLCFGTYLIHPLFINTVYKVLKITPLSFNRYRLSTLLFWIIFAVCSLITSRIMYLIPFLRKYIL